MAEKADLQLELQVVHDDGNLPAEDSIRRWVNACLTDRSGPLELVVRIVDETESAELNEAYRQKRGPTNVLSFPSVLPQEMAPDFLGDLVICSTVVSRESVEQGKTAEAHWAHMLVHGTLHLLGYDHLDDAEAEAMEALEKDILNKLGFDNPYETG